MTHLRLHVLGLLLIASCGKSEVPSTPPSDAFDSVAQVIGARMVDLNGEMHHLGMADAPRTTVFVFVDTGCPISNRYAPSLNELAGKASAAGVGFYGVLSDPLLSAAEGRAYRDEFGLSFPILFDPNGDLARRLAPTHVPEAFVVGGENQLYYRGRIDDRFAAVGELRAQITSHDLAATIEAVADGSLAETRRADPIGCVFEAWKDDVADRAITYARNVAPILNANCVTCHRPGDIGPFPLTNYADARRRARMIAQVCNDGFMPPWKAEQGYGSFKNARHLSALQLEVLAAWAAADAPEGEDEALPLPTLPDGRWRLGEPDYVLSMPVDFEVPADSDDVYRYFSIPSELLEDTPVAAFDFRPGDPSVVHHSITYLDHRGTGKRLDDRTPEPGFGFFGNDEAGTARKQIDFRGAPIAGWAPGAQPSVLPPGVAWILPPKTDFILELHYHPTGKPAVDRSQLGFYFLKEPLEHVAHTISIGTVDIDILPGDDHYVREVWMDVPEDLEVLEAYPHLHYLGRVVEAHATLPDGTVVPLLRITDWDFRWQDSYVYSRPIELPAGTRIDARFVYDNSEDNPSNPSRPPRRIKEGWQTFDEMCVLYFNVILKGDEDVRRLQKASLASYSRPADP